MSSISKMSLFTHQGDIIEHVDITMISNCSNLFLNKHDDNSHGTGALAFLKARQPETRSLGISLILEYSSDVA